MKSKSKASWIHDQIMAVEEATDDFMVKQENGGGRRKRDEDEAAFINFNAGKHGMLFKVGYLH